MEIDGLDRWLRLFGFGRIFGHDLLHHVVQLALDFVGVAFFDAGNAAPHQGMGAAISQVNDERAFVRRYVNHPRAHAPPSRGIGFNFAVTLRTELIDDIQIRWSVNLGQAFRGKIFHDVSLYLLFDQLAIQGGVVASQLTIQKGKCLVLGEISGLVKLDCDLLGHSLTGQQG